MRRPETAFTQGDGGEYSVDGTLADCSTAAVAWRGRAIIHHAEPPLTLLLCPAATGNAGDRDGRVLPLRLSATGLGGRWTDGGVSYRITTILVWAQGEEKDRCHLATADSMLRLAR